MKRHVFAIIEKYFPSPKIGEGGVRYERSAFTLIELLVVIAIIGLLSTVAVVATSSSQVSARNTKRKADLLQISKALELYYNDNGSYPTTSDGFWGTCGGGGSRGANEWIPNLVANGYMGQLPSDPTNRMSPYAVAPCDASWSCYGYMSNGNDYKVLALCTPEGANAFSAGEPYIDPSRSDRSWALYSAGGTLF